MRKAEDPREEAGFSKKVRANGLPAGKGQPQTTTFSEQNAGHENATHSMKIRWNFAWEGNAD